MSERQRYFIMYKDGRHEPCDSVAWSRWFESADRQVCNTEQDGVRVSTVMLGLDHSSSSVGTPMLYETLIFGGGRDGDGCRYSTMEEAKAGHDEMCRQVWPAG